MEPTTAEFIFYILAIIGLLVYIGIKTYEPVEDVYDPYRYCPKEEEEK